MDVACCVRSYAVRCTQNSASRGGRFCASAMRCVPTPYYYPLCLPDAFASLQVTVYAAAGILETGISFAHP